MGTPRIHIFKGGLPRYHDRHLTKRVWELYIKLSTYTNESVDFAGAYQIMLTIFSIYDSQL